MVTVVAGRRDHLVAQQQTLAATPTPVPDPSIRVVVAMDDQAVDDLATDLPGATVVRLPVAAGAPLPLAAARNLGAAVALDAGADSLVFLDVDCLVGPTTIPAYAEAAVEAPDVVWCGPVTYLTDAQRPYPLDRLADLDDPHPARPAPAPGERLPGGRWELFWSLSFALSAAAWHRSGGFDERYAGYGAEDTDFGQRAAAAGLRLGWLGAARAYHQHHPTATPPVQHLDDILRNGRLFAQRWGWWPMDGWLRGFAELGLVRDAETGWERVPAVSPAAVSPAPDSPAAVSPAPDSPAADSSGHASVTR